MPSTSKVISLASAASANCRSRSSSPTCCTAWINVMLSVVIRITHGVKVDFGKLHLTGVFPMTQPLGHPQITPRQWTLPGDLFEDFMAVDAAVMAHHQGGGVDKRHSGRLPCPGLKVDAQGNQDGGDHGHQPVITEPVRKGISQVLTDLEQVVGFEVAVVGLMKMDQDRHEFAQRQAATPEAVTLAVL